MTFGSIAGVLLTLGFVLALLGIALKLLRRFAPTSTKGATLHMEVVQLERLAGEPIDLYVADRRFAEGDVVVLGEHFGVRITRIISNVPLTEGIA